MKEMKAALLVLDFDLYPRNNVDSGNVSRILNAMAAGEEMPPVIIDKRTKRVADGFHRVRAALRKDPDSSITVIEKAYKNDQELFLDAMRLNANHGAPLDPCDRTHCVLIAERLSIPIDAVAGALHMPSDRLGKLRTTRVATAASQPVPLKRTVAAQFNGKKLTARQAEANTKLSGMNQVFYANQLIELLESKMLDTDDEKLMARLQVLHELLDGVLVA